MLHTWKLNEINAEEKTGSDFRRHRPTSGKMRPSNTGRTHSRRMWMKSHFEQMRDASKIGYNDLMPTSSSFALVEEAVRLWGIERIRDVGVDRIRIG